MNMINSVLDPVLVFGILFIGFYATADYCERAYDRVVEAVRQRKLKSPSRCSEVIQNTGGNKFLARTVNNSPDAPRLCVTARYHGRMDNKQKG